MLPVASSPSLPARALLGRLLAVRVAVLGGWVVGLAWLHLGLGIPMPLAPMGGVLLLMAAFSISTVWRLRLDAPATQLEFLAHLLADLTAFAVLVFFSGGVTNPFVSLMLLPVVIAAISLRPVGVWLVAGVAGAYYLLLLFHFQPLAVTDPIAAYGMHLAGMWFNFLISAGLVAFFVTRMHAALRARDNELAALRERQLRDERILALGTQAALAAHELATPLATIQTTAHELAREFANDPEIGDDCRLLEKQARACKQILTKLAARGADSAAPRALDAWIEGVVERWQIMRPDARLDATIATGADAFLAPDGLEHAIVNLLNNAADASTEAVSFGASVEEGELRIVVCDRGPGLSEIDRARAGRTVFAHGAPADREITHGWGMGLALTHAALERLGGALALDAREGGGTCARLRVPLVRGARR